MNRIKKTINEGTEKGNVKSPPSNPRPEVPPPPQTKQEKEELWYCLECGHHQYYSGPPGSCNYCSSQSIHNFDEDMSRQEILARETNKKTMSALAAEVEKRLWKNVEKRSEQLIHEELSAIDEILEAMKNEIQRDRRPPERPLDPSIINRYAELLKVRADMRTQAVSNLLRAKRPEIIKKT